MRVVVVLENRFHRTPDGTVWTEASNDYAFWTRYLDVFDDVRVVARVAERTAAGPAARRADGAQVNVAALPSFAGAAGYVRQRGALRAALEGALAGTDAVILRVPGVIEDVAERCVRPPRPFGVEVVGDPLDVFAPGGIRSLLRPVLRWWVPRQLRRQCARACAAAYVTESILQARYPPGPGAFSTHYSSIELTDEAFATAPRARAAGGPLRLAFVGSLAQLYKGPDVLIDAVAALVRSGLDLTLELIGDGKHRAELEQRAAAHGLAPRVRFLGQLPGGAAVRAQLDASDLFVLPSRTEGLPRALIEAMARGLACIGSRVGGFAELLPPEDLAEPGSVADLAAHIRAVATDAPRRAAAAARNLAKAREYHTDILRQRRRAFYAAVHDATAAWRGA